METGIKKSRLSQLSLESLFCKKYENYIKNWIPMYAFLLNVYMKLISKALASCLKNVITTIVNEYLVAFVNNRFISEGGRLV